jgi:Uncharacterized protein conserved in bacteria
MRKKVYIIKIQWIYTAAIAILLVLSAALYLNVLVRQTGKSALAKPPAHPANSYSILIDTEEKRLYLLRNGKLYKQYRCAVGKKETPSPLGSYQITQKAHWGEGFGGYWLGINCPWGNFGIHGTRRPDTVGLSSSHGCFRMYNSDIAQLYAIVRCGTPVRITGSFGAFGSGFRTILPGMYGLDIEAIQKRLKQMGYYSGPCSGVYDDDRFTAAIHRFQSDHGLAISDSVSIQMITALGFVLMD